MEVDIGGRFSGPPSGSDPKERVKTGILDEFRRRKVTVLNQGWLEHYSFSLDPLERAAVPEAIGDLVGSGLLERVEEPLALTAKGIREVFS